MSPKFECDGMNVVSTSVFKSCNRMSAVAVGIRFLFIVSRS